MNAFAFLLLPFIFAEVGAVVNDDVFVYRVADIAPGNQSMKMQHFVAVKDRIYFVGRTEKNDGDAVYAPTTAASTSSMRYSQNWIYSINTGVVGADDKNGSQWQVLADTGSLFADELYVLNNQQILFTGEDKEHGRELWAVDENKQEKEAHRVKDVYSGPSSSFVLFKAFPVFSGNSNGHIVYFVARTLGDNSTYQQARQLYRSDGTPNGTLPVTKLDASVRQLEYSRHSVEGLDYTFYIVYNRREGKGEIWISKGWHDEYEMFELNDDLAYTYLINILPESLNGKIAFSYRKSAASNDFFLWTIDPETGEQQKVMGGLRGHIGLSQSLPAYSQLAGTYQQIHCVKKGTRSVAREETPTAVVVTDGSVSGTHEIKTFDPVIEGVTKGVLSLNGSKVMIIQERLTANTPCSGEGSNDVTASVRNSGEGNSSRSDSPKMVTDLWITNGTVDGTFLSMTLPENTLVTKGHAISGGRVVLLVTKLIQMNKQQLASTYELWVTDGTQNGTSIVYTSPLSQTLALFFRHFSIVWQHFTTAWTKDRLVFTGYDVEHGVEPWMMRFRPYQDAQGDAGETGA